MILMKSLDEVSKVPWALELLLYKTQNVKSRLSACVWT